MSLSNILNRLFFAGILLLLAIQFTSCSNLQSGNFLKQKYLRGQLSSVYDENKTADSTDSVAEQFTPPAIDNHSSADLGSGEKTTTDQFSNHEEISEQAPDELHHTQQQPAISENDPLPARDPILKTRLKKTGKQSPAQPTKSATITWVLVLLLLALIALPFALLIGFWAFVICVVFLTISSILIISSDLDGGGDSVAVKIFNSLILLIIMVALLALICMAAMVALVWFVVWGIVQLIN
ncbi:MAG: hypothetical protein HYZ14_10970 [Bacteroidetes bacterium]|nr:hypothetical protein [Bacteroidota bacterium]